MQSPLRRITSTSEEALSLNPSMSGDGRIVAFESTEDVAGVGGIETFRAIRADVALDSPAFVQLGVTRAPAPAISQDGSRIAFSSKDNPLGTNADGNTEIFLYDGAKLIQITNTSPGGVANRVANGNFLPSISDDGRYIAFSSNRDLANQNADGNLEIFTFDTTAVAFTQLTESSGIVGCTDAKISGEGASLAYIRDDGAAPSVNRALLLQNLAGAPSVRTLASNAQNLAMTFGRAISDDGKRVVWSAETATNASQVFLYDGRNNQTRQITTLGARVTDAPLQATISGDGSRIAFATRRSVSGTGSNSDGSVELYTYEIPSATFGRVTNTSSSDATADVVSSMNDDGSIIAFNFPRVLTGVSNEAMANNSEIYVTETPPRPAFGTLNIVNGASFGREPATIEAVAPDSIAVAFGAQLANTTEQSQKLPNGTFPTTVGGTTVTVNGRPAHIFFVSPSQVNFLVPPETEPGFVEVVVTNPDGFPSRGTVASLRAAPGLFTFTGDGVGEGVVLNADTLQPGPFNPTNGNLRLIIFSTGVRNGLEVSVSAGGRALAIESIVSSPDMPGLDEVHVLVPADLRGAGPVDLIIRADLRDSNPVSVSFEGNPQRDIVINEFLADPPGSAATDLQGDANHDGVRNASADEFVELVNSTTHDIDISGYQIFTRGAPGSADILRHTFPTRTILPSCTAIVVFGGGDPDASNPVFGGAQIQAASTGSITLNNSSGVITLRDQATTVAGFVAYGGSTGLAADDNQSLTRSPDITGNLTKHLTVSGGTRVFSPGTQLGGAAFGSCTTPISRVEVSPGSAAIDVGAQQQFTARAFDSGNNEVPGVILFWESSNTPVATIDQSGLATGVSAGTAEIRATGRGVQSAPATLTVNPVAPPNVIINEVDSDQAGPDTSEFVELYDGGTGNTSLAGLVVVFFNGGDDHAYAAFDLDGATTNGNGYFTLGNAAVPGVDRTFADGLMQNGADAVALYVGNASDFPNGTAVSVTNLIDALVYDTNDADNPGLLALLNAGQPQVNEDAGGNGVTNSSQRCPNASGSVRNTSSYAQFAPTADSANVCVVQAPPPDLTINDVSSAEGNSGTTTITFTVNLSSPAPAGGVTFDIATADSTATVTDNDYVAKSLTSQTIAAGGQTYDFLATVKGDQNIEPNEVFFVNVTNVSGATVVDGQGAGTIQNDDSPTLTIDDVSANEGDSGTTTFTFTVTSSLPAPAGGIIFDIATQDNTATVGNSDYLAQSLTRQMIPAAQTSYTFQVTVNGDTLVESSETFFVNVTNVSGATISDGQGLGTIQNDDAAHVVISQLYGAGGNSGATLRNDFIEVFNRGTSTVDLAGWSVQYTSAGGTTWQVMPLCPIGSCLLLPGCYFLVQQASGGANGALLPTPDAAGTISMAATAGKVALVSSTTVITGSGCPFATEVLDLVGYGTTPDCFEGTGRAPAPGATTADVRKGGGCVDTNDNAADFFLHAPSPHNGSHPANICSGQTVDLTINNVTVTETNDGTVAATFTVTLHGSTGSTVTVDYSTADGSASASADYQATPTTQLVFNPGDISKTITVNVYGDTLDEPDETFLVNLTNASNAAIFDNQGQGTITDDDVPPTLTVNDVVVNEGNGGTTTFAFSVHLSAPALTGGVTFDIGTADGTGEDGNPATEDNDYIAQSIMGQTIPAGSQEFNFNVIVNGDLNIESNEIFFVNVTNLSGATVSDAQGQGVIRNDDSPTLSIDDVTVNEGNAGPTIFTFTVTSSLPAPVGGITFDIATADGTAQDDNSATDDNDYVPQILSGQTIGEGLTTYMFHVIVNGDTKNEAVCETFFVNLSNATNATIADPQGQGSITDEDGTKLVISQIYGGGGNASAAFTNDFIEIFNRGNTAVSLNGMSIQYSAATSTTGNYSVTALPNVILQPGQYFLIQEASGGATGSPLTPDATGTIAMAAGAGKVALVNGTAALPAAGCPSGPTIIDFVGYGSTANCREGASTADNAPGPSNNISSAQRKLAGCQDFNINQQDFVTAAVAPRNMATTINSCSCSTSYSSLFFGFKPFKEELAFLNCKINDPLITLDNTKTLSESSCASWLVIFASVTTVKQFSVQTLACSTLAAAN